MIYARSSTQARISALLGKSTVLQIREDEKHSIVRACESACALMPMLENPHPGNAVILFGANEPEIRQFLLKTCPDGSRAYKEVMVVHAPKGEDSRDIYRRASSSDDPIIQCLNNTMYDGEINQDGGFICCNYDKFHLALNLLELPVTTLIYNNSAMSISTQAIVKRLYDCTVYNFCTRGILIEPIAYFLQPMPEELTYLTKQVYYNERLGYVCHLYDGTRGAIAKFWPTDDPNCDREHVYDDDAANWAGHFDTVWTYTEDGLDLAARKTILKDCGVMSAYKVALNLSPTPQVMYSSRYFPSHHTMFLARTAAGGFDFVCANYAQVNDMALQIMAKFGEQAGDVANWNDTNFITTIFNKIVIKSHLSTVIGGSIAAKAEANPYNSSPADLARAAITTAYFLWINSQGRTIAFNERMTLQLKALLGSIKDAFLPRCLFDRSEFSLEKIRKLIFEAGSDARKLAINTIGEEREFILSPSPLAKFFKPSIRDCLLQTSDALNCRITDKLFIDDTTEFMHRLNARATLQNVPVLCTAITAHEMALLYPEDARSALAAEYIRKQAVEYFSDANAVAVVVSRHDKSVHIRALGQLAAGVSLDMRPAFVTGAVHIATRGQMYNAYGKLTKFVNTKSAHPRHPIKNAVFESVMLKLARDRNLPFVYLGSADKGSERVLQELESVDVPMTVHLVDAKIPVAALRRDYGIHDVQIYASERDVLRGTPFNMLPTPQKYPDWVIQIQHDEDEDPDIHVEAAIVHIDDNYINQWDNCEPSLRRMLERAGFRRDERPLWAQFRYLTANRINKKKQTLAPIKARFSTFGTCEFMRNNSYVYDAKEAHVEFEINPYDLDDWAASTKAMPHIVAVNRLDTTTDYIVYDDRCHVSGTVENSELRDKSTFCIAKWIPLGNEYLVVSKKATAYFCPLGNYHEFRVATHNQTFLGGELMVDANSDLEPLAFDNLGVRRESALIHTILHGGQDAYVYNWSEVVKAVARHPMQADECSAARPCCLHSTLLRIGTPMMNKLGLCFRHGSAADTKLLDYIDSEKTRAMSWRFRHEDGNNQVRDYTIFNDYKDEIFRTIRSLEGSKDFDMDFTANPFKQLADAKRLLVLDAVAGAGKTSALPTGTIHIAPYRKVVQQSPFLAKTYDVGLPFFAKFSRVPGEEKRWLLIDEAQAMGPLAAAYAQLAYEKGFHVAICGDRYQIKWEKRNPNDKEKETWEKIAEMCSMYAYGAFGCEVSNLSLRMSEEQCRFVRAYTGVPIYGLNQTARFVFCPVNTFAEAHRCISLSGSDSTVLTLTQDAKTAFGRQASTAAENGGCNLHHYQAVCIIAPNASREPDTQYVEGHKGAIYAHKYVMLTRGSATVYLPKGCEMYIDLSNEETVLWSKQLRPSYEAPVNNALPVLGPESMDVFVVPGKCSKALLESRFPGISVSTVIGAGTPMHFGKEDLLAGEKALPYELTSEERAHELATNRSLASLDGVAFSKVRSAISVDSRLLGHTPVKATVFNPYAPILSEGCVVRRDGGPALTTPLALEVAASGAMSMFSHELLANDPAMFVEDGVVKLPESQFTPDWTTGQFHQAHLDCANDLLRARFDCIEVENGTLQIGLIPAIEERVKSSGSNGVTVDLEAVFDEVRDFKVMLFGTAIASKHQRNNVVTNATIALTRYGQDGASAKFDKLSPKERRSWLKEHNQRMKFFEACLPHFFKPNEDFDLESSFERCVLAFLHDQAKKGLLNRPVRMEDFAESLLAYVQSAKVQQKTPDELEPDYVPSKKVGQPTQMQASGWVVSFAAWYRVLSEFIASCTTEDLVFLGAGSGLGTVFRRFKKRGFKHVLEGDVSECDVSHFIQVFKDVLTVLLHFLTGGRERTLGFFVRCIDTIALIMAEWYCRTRDGTVRAKVFGQLASGSPWTFLLNCLWCLYNFCTDIYEKHGYKRGLELIGECSIAIAGDDSLSTFEADPRLADVHTNLYWVKMKFKCAAGVGSFCHHEFTSDGYHPNFTRLLAKLLAKPFGQDPTKELESELEESKQAIFNLTKTYRTFEHLADALSAFKQRRGFNEETELIALELLIRYAQTPARKLAPLLQSVVMVARK